ncbi:MAG: AAA family ATPase [Oscillospiraceae bacterium]|nr:AAA family ATPase [Oscillospiraceae bacterium]
MNEIESGLCSVTVKEMTELLGRAYVTLLQTGTPLRSFPSVMLWGPPGVGKSQGVREIAGIIRRKTGKKTVITDVRLLLFNPVDLRGIPTANEDRTLAVWLKPKIFQMDESPDTVNILFLDEISAAPPSVQAAAYQITLDRTVGEHTLPENCIVIAAGNRASDKSVAYNMPKALANRLCHFEIKGDAASWHDWAVKAGVHPYVTGYLEYNPSALMRFEPAGVGLAFPTPRSWEMVSGILNTVSADLEKVWPLVVGCIGYTAASGFRSWTELYASMPDAAKIFDGQKTEIPKAQELLIALRSVMVRYAAEHPEKTKIENAITYACKLPWSFRGKLLHDFYLFPSLRPILRENEVFRTAIQSEQS